MVDDRPPIPASRSAPGPRDRSSDAPTTPPARATRRRLRSGSTARTNRQALAGPALSPSAACGWEGSAGERMARGYFDGRNAFSND